MERLLGQLDALLRTPVETVPLRSVRVVDQTRVGAEGPGHLPHLLPDVACPPPVLVHRPTMTVLHGVHRLPEEAPRGRTTLAVRYFDGDPEEGHLLAVALDVTLGLAVTTRQRVVAAERVLTVRPHWSDRSVALVAGLSSGKTAEIRRRLLGTSGPGAKRLGRDGRARPLDPSRGRERVAALVRENPEASLRHIARLAGVSPTTVATVRDRIAREDGPGAGPDTGHVTTEAVPRPAEPPVPTSAVADEDRPPDPDEIRLLLRRDPSLRFTEAGRSVLRLLDAGAVMAREGDAIAAGLPPHCRSAVARLAEAYARSWQLFADEVQSSRTTATT